MENSINSMSKALSSNERTSGSPEESGWTVYFEDFLVNNNNEEHMMSRYCSSRFETSNSLVSDAASLIGKKSMVKSSKRLSFKKRKTIGALVDDSLEDTASSPVSSPKVCNELNEMNMKIAKRSDNTEISQEKGSASGQIEERSEVGFIGRDSDCTELKKSGLCLVPFSMLINYFG
ncbi:vascular-related unknown protein 1-like [Corylus avellana]|uniref:vascular-related unknown protein 1-like n=1 Tax=Corylus avellana TaxID=13451 RepID=UPI001E223D26|nr:vascular-related unknown protein 1-like [Corylus avellana]XP_059444701.1 vascular-related unknown protein 1-like [Corylus avellana]